jgi:acyl carrier protein
MRYSLDSLVRQVVARHLAVAPCEIAPMQHLERDLGLDPLDLVLIALRLEDIEQIEFPMSRLEGAETVGDLTRILRAVRASEPAVPVIRRASPSRRMRRSVGAT